MFKPEINIKQEEKLIQDEDRIDLHPDNDQFENPMNEYSYVEHSVVDDGMSIAGESESNIMNQDTFNGMGLQSPS